MVHEEQSRHLRDARLDGRIGGWWAGRSRRKGGGCGELAGLEMEIEGVS